MKSHVKTKWFFAAVCTLVVPSLVFAPKGGASTPRSDLDHAAYLRSTLGFDDSAAVVERAAFDFDAYPDMTWGIPMSIAEAAEMQRRIALMHVAFPVIS